MKAATQQVVLYYYSYYNDLLSTENDLARAIYTRYKCANFHTLIIVKEHDRLTNLLILIMIIIVSIHYEDDNEKMMQFSGKFESVYRTKNIHYANLVFKLSLTVYRSYCIPDVTLTQRLSMASQFSKHPQFAFYVN